MINGLPVPTNFLATLVIPTLKHVFVMWMDGPIVSFHQLFTVLSRFTGQFDETFIEANDQVQNMPRQSQKENSAWFQK